MGYNTCDAIQASTAKSLYNMMSIPFEKVDGKGVSLNDLQFSDATAGRATSADQIKLWVVQENGSYDYETWYYQSAKNGWLLSGGKTTDTFDSKYPNGLPAGTTFWYKSAQRAVAGTLTTSGAVAADESVTVTIKRDSYNFVGYPYPVALNLNDANMVNWGDAVSGRATSADQIKLWLPKDDGSYDYETWYYQSAKNGWLLSGGKATDTFQSVHPEGVKVGTGFWYKAAAKSGSETFDVTFISPLAPTESAE